eukprot:Seg17453.1 transcript_id=Seg17453.1/GoldUCD/mRNA.D3Y31 product="Glutamine-fructose-6-phosphate aminotransferase" protein_id=Seg17453.1/GoldUCD/D3Y31
MCGIVAYTGDRSATPILLNGLRKLEYRGYDSAGIAIHSDNSIHIYKQEGKVANLVDSLGEYDKEELHQGANAGIAHTRWATHGPPTTANAHPHAATDNRVALVHNGIIENYRALKARLEADVREADEKGALVAGLVNVVGSTIAREAGRGIYLHAGPEISVASTKAFTCQVSVLLLIALKFARSRRLSREAGVQIAHEINRLPELVEKVLEKNEEIEKVAADFVKYDNMFYIGRGYLYPVAMEGALKIKEISYIHAEAYHAAELKHGPIALLEESMPVVALLNKGPGSEKTIGNVEECRARKSPVLGIITEGDEDAKAACDWTIEVPDSPHYTATVTSTVALQLFSYHVARLRGCPIDQPRNLAKSVTVE